MNGAVDQALTVTDVGELTVRPEDDGLQIVDFVKGDFEWWYFDINDPGSGCFLKIVVHIGTDPLKTRILPQIAISINTPERSENIFIPFSFSEMEADTRLCSITVGDKIKIRTEFKGLPEYFIEIDIPGLKCSFIFKSHIEGWKPFGKKIPYQSGKKRGDFSWIVPAPRAKVEGDFFYDNKKYILTNAIGYHDHNYMRPDRENPLFIDDLAIKWYWGKCYSDRFTVIFADIFSKINRTLPLMAAEHNKIIHSSNNLTDCSVSSYGYDKLLKTTYPASIKIKSLDKHFDLKAEFEFYKILDRKDLLDGVNPAIKYLIKRLVARPVYHGILTRVRFEINNSQMEGPGNFESMVFREK